MESDWLTVKCYSEFLQKGIDKLKDCQKNESTKRIYLRTEKKGKHGAEEKVTVTEGLAATDKG